MAKVFHVDYSDWRITERVRNVLPTVVNVTGTPSMAMTEKGYAITWLTVWSNSKQYDMTLPNTQVLHAFFGFYFSRVATDSYLFDLSNVATGNAPTLGFRINADKTVRIFVQDFGNLYGASYTLTMGRWYWVDIEVRLWICYIRFNNGTPNNMFTTTQPLLQTTRINTGSDRTQWRSNINYLSSLEIYDDIQTEVKRQELYQNFLNKRHAVAVPTTYETVNVLDFDQNETWDNYVKVNDSSDFDFWVGSFSIYWEDTYPQRQPVGWGRILDKDNGVTGFSIYHPLTAFNDITYFERNTAINATIASAIPRGKHKFLFVKDVTSLKIFFYCDGALITTLTGITTNNVSSAANLYIRTRWLALSTKSTGFLRNLKIWKWQAITPSQVNTYKQGLVVDMPIDDWTWLVVKNYANPSLNGAITATFPLACWTKKTFPSDVSIIDRSFDRADGTVITPNGCISGTGTFKLATATSNQWNYGGIVSGDNYLECVTAGTLSLPSNRAYGTVEVDVYNAATATDFVVYFLNTVMPTAAASWTWYRLLLSWSEFVALDRVLSGVHTRMMQSANNYIQTGTWYRFAKTRDINWNATLYVKGGAFGSKYVLLSTSWWLGVNPALSNTVTTSNFFGLYMSPWDRVGKIIRSNDVLSLI